MSNEVLLGFFNEISTFKVLKEDEAETIKIREYKWCGFIWNFKEALTQNHNIIEQWAISQV